MSPVDTSSMPSNSAPMLWQLKTLRRLEKSPRICWRYSCRLLRELHGRTCPVLKSRIDPYWRFMNENNREIRPNTGSPHDEGNGFVKYCMLHSPFPWPWPGNKHMAIALIDRSNSNPGKNSKVQPQANDQATLQRGLYRYH